MDKINYYDLNKEYPVSYEFWKDLAAIFIYLGIFKFFIWKGGFKTETLKQIKKAFKDAEKKIATSDITFLEYELAKDGLSNNYSSFRYYFERAEKISSFNLLKKIEWTIENVKKNLDSRISPKNRFYIESDFYDNAYRIVYNKIVIHHYAINNLNVEPVRLIYDPLLIDINYQDNNGISEIDIKINNFQVSYLIDVENRISLSKKFSNIFINADQFQLIDFSKLKEYNLVYDVKLSGFQLRNNRYKGDLILLIFLLNKFKVISLPSDKYIIEIFKEIFDITISANNFNIYKEVLLNYENSKKISLENVKSIEKCNDFINKYILKI